MFPSAVFPKDRLYYGISTYRTTASNMGYDLGPLVPKRPPLVGCFLHDESSFSQVETRFFVKNKTV